VLGTVPGWRPLRVAAYGAAVGDPQRWPSPKQLYRAAGLTPRIYESAGRRRDGHITREGSVPLRVALVDLGLGLWHKEPAARAHGAALRARGKLGAVITIAMANRANRIAFAMVRDQRPWDGSRWAR
jgi:transposase